MTTANREACKTFYEESKAACEQLESTLRSYRTATTSVLALATGAATFFGLDDSTKGGFYYLALVVYGTAALLAATLFLPAKWMTNVADGGKGIIEGDPERFTPGETYLLLGDAHQQAWHANRRNVLSGWRGVPVRFGLLVFLTSLVVVLSLLNVGVESKDVPAEPTRVVLIDDGEVDANDG